MRAIRRGGKNHVVTITITCLGLLLLFALTVLMFGHVGGEEFSPQRFSRRSFSYYQIPLLRIQIWPVRVAKISNKASSDLAKYLRTNKLLGNSNGQPPRWDLVSMIQIGGGSYRGDALVLTSYLQQPGATGTESWLSWSKNNPKLAQELWPVVARMARENMYVTIPNLFEAARLAESKEQLAAEIRRVVVSELSQFADAERKRGDVARANQLIRIALEFDPDNSALLEAKT